MKKQLNYWYKKYVPVFIQNIINFKMFRSLLIYISKSFRYGKFEKTIQSKARNAGISYYASNDDDIATLNNNLIKKVCKWGELAYSIKLVADHSLPGAKFYNQFPGEHYRLLASIVNTEKPVLMIDIGTYTGMSSKVLLDHSESDSRIITFDLIKWDNFDSYLKKEDFDSGRIVQEISDLSIVDNFLEHKKNFNDADLIFIDAPKDGKFEKIFFKNLSNINFDNKKRILIIDDIRVPEMFEAWRFIDSPKLDATTFGHWSGTGIVDITEGLKLK